jgi:hypothetical protein
MPFFSPPTDDFVVFGSTDDDQAETLFSKIAGRPRGRNVYELSNGTYTENQPPFLSDVVRTYYGGHSTEITQAEADNLTEAGYGDYIT